MSQTQRYVDTSRNCVCDVYDVFTYEIYGTGNTYIILQENMFCSVFNSVSMLTYVLNCHQYALPSLRKLAC